MANVAAKFGVAVVIGFGNDAVIPTGRFTTLIVIGSVEPARRPTDQFSTQVVLRPTRRVKNASNVNSGPTSKLGPISTGINRFTSLLPIARNRT